MKSIPKSDPCMPELGLVVEEEHPMDGQGAHAH